jgi:NADPH:quinone reductase-like Zn-dependent oxidoreductase
MHDIWLTVVITSGGFAEYILLFLSEMRSKIPDNLDWDVAASSPVIGVTPFYALKEAGVRINEFFLIFGASGNTGMIATQLGKKMDASKGNCSFKRRRMGKRFWS